jgi:hypothetical protein
LAEEPPLAADEASFLPAVDAPVPMVEDALDPLPASVADEAPVPMLDDDSPCLAEEPPAPMDEELDCAYAKVAVPASSVAASAARRTCLNDM